MDTLTLLERSAMKALLERAGQDYASLWQQAAVCRVLSRDSNSAGFVTNLEVVRALPPVISPLASKRPLGGVNADIPGLEGGAGFMLWLKDGYLDALEGFAYLGFPGAEDRWQTVTSFEIHII